MKSFLSQFTTLVVSTLVLPVCLAATPSAEQVRQLAIQGSVHDAKSALTECSKKQDAECQLMHAEWIERGEVFPRDMIAARKLYEEALKNGEHVAGEHILRLLREEVLPSTAYIAPSPSVTPVKTPSVAESASIAQQQSSPPVPLLVADDDQQVAPPPSFVISRPPAHCQSRISGRISTLRCGQLLLAIQPVAHHENRTIVLVRAENRGTEAVRLDNSQFEFSRHGQPVYQAVDETVAIAIDERSKDAKSDNLVKGVFSSVVSIAAAAFMHSSGLDLPDLDPGYMIANGISEAAGGAALSSFKAAHGNGNKTSVRYFNRVELPSASFAEGLLAIEALTSERVKITFTSPYGVGTVAISGL